MVTLTDRNRGVLEIIKEHQPITRVDLMRLYGKRENATHLQLKRLLAAGLVECPVRGMYCTPEKAEVIREALRRPET